MPAEICFMDRFTETGFCVVAMPLRNEREDSKTLDCAGENPHCGRTGT